MSIKTYKLNSIHNVRFRQPAEIEEGQPAALGAAAEKAVKTPPEGVKIFRNC